MLGIEIIFLLIALFLFIVFMNNKFFFNINWQFFSPLHLTIKKF